METNLQVNDHDLTVNKCYMLTSLYWKDGVTLFTVCGVLKNHVIMDTAGLSLLFLVAWRKKGSKKK